MGETAIETPKKQLLSTLQMIGAALGIIVAGKAILFDFLEMSPDWIKWYVFAIVPGIGLLSVNVLKLSWKRFLGRDLNITGRRFPIAVLCFFSILFILNLRLVYGLDPTRLAFDLLLNLGASILGVSFFFWGPWLLRWSTAEDEWPINASSFVLGFVPWLVSLALAIASAESSLRVFYVVMSVACGASFTWTLGFSHPKNLAYDMFIAKVILVGYLAIVIPAGLGGLALGIVLWLRGDGNEAILWTSAVAWWGLILSFVGLIVVYRYQYQGRLKADKMRLSG